MHQEMSELSVDVQICLDFMATKHKQLVDLLRNNFRICTNKIVSHKFKLCDRKKNARIQALQIEMHAVLICMVSQWKKRHL